MSRDEIMTLATACRGQYWMDEAHIQRFAAFVAEAEREACARMVTECAWNLKGPEAAVAVEACAAAIRARGEK